MATSNTTGYSRTALQHITNALKSIRVLTEGATPSPAQQADGLEAINLMLKSWATNGASLWRYYEVVIPLVSNQLSYTIGPGADINVIRPYNVMEYGNFYRRQVGTQNFDTPLRLISRSEYLQFGSKGSPGIPNSIYYNPSIDLTVPGGATGAAGHGLLYVYLPMSTPSLGNLHLNAQRQLFDVATVNEEVDVPQDAYLAFKYELMFHLAEDNEVPEDRIARYYKLAEDYKTKFFDANVESAPTTFGMDNTGR